MLCSTDLLRLALDLPIPDIVIPMSAGIPTDPRAEGHPVYPELAVADAHWPSDLRGYQRFIVDQVPKALANKTGFVVALEPGAGKTGTLLTAIRRQLDAGTIRKVLIVTGTLLIAKTVWQEEIYEWVETANTTWTLLRVEDDHPDVVAAASQKYEEAKAYWQQRFDDERAPLLARGWTKTQASDHVRKKWHAEAMANRTVGDKMEKRKLRVTPAEKADEVRQSAALAEKDRQMGLLFNEPTEVHIIAKHELPWLWNKSGRGRDWLYDLIVCDDMREGRSGKRRVARSTRKDTGEKGGAAPLSRWGILAQARKHSKALIQLAGTPTPKGLENIWGLAYLADPESIGVRLKPSKSAYLAEWFNQDRYSYKITPRESAFSDIMGRVKDIMFSMRDEDRPELPTYIVDPIRVKLPPEVLKAYKQFERDMVSDAYEVEAANAGVLHGKLLQFANGSMYRGPGDDVPIHDCKIEALKDLVERMNGTPLLVFYTYKFDVDRICQAFPQAVVLTPKNALEVKRKWNSDKIELLLAHRESAGHGLNLQKGTGHMCEYGLTADSELYAQALKRLWRSGRKDSVINHVIIAEGTIDEYIYPDYLDPKIAEQARILREIEI